MTSASAHVPRILIQATPVGGRSVTLDSSDEWGTVETGTGPAQLIDAYDDLKVVLRHVAADLGQSVTETTLGPTKIELTFGLTLTAGVNAWVIRAGGEATVSVTMTWARE